ncbi:MAG: Rid family detoxifying hydrolase [Desulfocapsaceae bacterium]|nr:Rid family detoxifying hydrolase [Desulfocapsaceae bacterium]
MKKIIQTDNAPAAIGPYSQAIISGELMFISGQLAIDPKTGKLIEGSIAAQTERILANIDAIAIAAGASLTQVVKTTVFLKDLNDFSEVNTAYSNFFTNNPPARSTVEVAALPLNASIEIEAIVSLS